MYKGKDTYHPLLMPLLFSFTSGMASVIGILGQNIYMPIFLPDEIIQWNKNFFEDAGVQIFSQIAPFPLVLSIVVWYVLPVYKHALPRNVDQAPSEVVIRRSLNLPLIVSLLGLGGWLIAGLINFLAYFILAETLALAPLITILMPILLTGSLTFVCSYYMLEYLTRKFIIKKFLKNAKLSSVKGIINFSLRIRFFILWYAISFYPFLILYLLILRLNNDGHNAIGANISAPLNTLTISLMIVTTAISYLISRSYRIPLVEMEAATREIQKGNLNIKLSAVSADELGILSEGLCDMAQELKEKELIKDTFGRMVDPSVRDHLLRSDLKLGGELVEATILFSDIRGFTALSESMTPEKIVSLLNRYFERMSACIATERGLINKFIGDAVMAVFGAPIVLENHAHSATRAALAMRHARQELNREFRDEGLPELAAGIGLHSGPVLAGNIGSQSRMEYTVIGDTVNLASRLEGLCKELELDLLISQATQRALQSGFDFERSPKSQGMMDIKGRADPIQVYSL